MTDITTVRTTAATNTITVKFTREVELLWVHCVYTSDATAGNRQIELTLTDGTNTYMDTFAGAVQAASNAYHYYFVPGIYRETAFTANEIEVPIATGTVIPAGFSLTLNDTAGVSASDTLVFCYQTKTR